MSRRPCLAGNFKLHLGPQNARDHALALRTRLLGIDAVDLAVFPTSMSVPDVVRVLEDTAIHVGVQHIAAAAEGAFTGRTSARHAREAGCQRALIGHSEVRRDLNVSDDDVHAATRLALTEGLLPVICLGETLAQRDAGEVEAVLTRQLLGALGDLAADEVATCTVAYEPVWAIGTGRTATPDQAQPAHALLRQLLADRYPPFVAEQTRILYGGSVNRDNAAALLSCPDVDGALVGGASLDPEAFAAIVQAAL